MTADKLSQVCTTWQRTIGLIAHRLRRRRSVLTPSLTNSLGSPCSSSFMITKLMTHTLISDYDEQSRGTQQQSFTSTYMYHAPDWNLACKHVCPPRYINPHSFLFFFLMFIKWNKHKLLYFLRLCTVYYPAYAQQLVSVVIVRWNTSRPTYLVNTFLF